MNKIINNESNDINDWRYRGQLKYLDNDELLYSEFKSISHNDHEHCAFCWAKFCELDGCLHEGYHSVDNYYWICPKCFNDFKHMFNWTIMEK